MSVAEENRKRGLGRGLSALFGEVDSEPSVGEIAPQAAADASPGGKELRLMPVEKLHPGRYQPRRVFDETAISDLVESVREKGVLQPLLVRPDPDAPGSYEIIAGERRWRAAQAASLHDVPVIVREMSDREALEVALIENLQRQDLTPLEEAEGYHRLQEEFSHTQEELAKTVGKSRSHVANMMRLLMLPPPIKDMLDRGDLTAGHARALLTARDPLELAEQVASKGLNVRQTEKLVQKEVGKNGGKKGASKNTQDADIVALERDLTQLLGLKVSIHLAGRGGEISIHYGTLEQLDSILHRLSQGLRGHPVSMGDGSGEIEIREDV